MEADFYECQMNIMNMKSICFLCITFLFATGSVNSAPVKKNVSTFLFKLIIEMSQNRIDCPLSVYMKKDNPDLSKNLWNWLEQQKKSEHFHTLGYTYYNLYVGPEDLAKCERTHLHFKFPDNGKKIVTIRNLTAPHYNATFDSTQPNNDSVFFKKPTIAEEANEKCHLYEKNGSRITSEDFEKLKKQILNETPHFAPVKIVKPE